MTATTSEFTYDKGITQIKEGEMNVGVGLQVVSGDITRNTQPGRWITAIPEIFMFRRELIRSMIIFII